MNKDITPAADVAADYYREAELRSRQADRLAEAGLTDTADLIRRSAAEDRATGDYFARIAQSVETR